MTSIPISNALLRSSMMTMAARDPVLMRAFETGEARSVPPSKPKHGLSRYVPRFISNACRVHPSSPDKAKSLRKKRKWGGSSCLPDWMRGDYTEGERAALAVVVQEVKRHGHCDLEINRIASIAGIHRTTVQNAMRKARKLKHIAVQERPGVAGQLSLTNIVRIICGAWKGWLRRVGSGFKKLNPSETKMEKEQRTTRGPQARMADEEEVAGKVVIDVERRDATSHLQGEWPVDARPTVRFTRQASVRC